MPARAPDKVSALGTAGRQAGVAMLKYCIVLSLGKNKSKQSTYAKLGFRVASAQVEQ